MKKRVIKMKVCVVGSQGAGKTTLIQKLIQAEEPPTPTEEYEVSIYCLDTKNAIMEIQLWDCANLHFQFHKHLRQAYFRNSSATLLLFDVTRPHWQQDIHNWISEAYDNQCYLIYAIATKTHSLLVDQARGRSSLGSGLRSVLEGSLESGRGGSLLGRV